MNGQQQQHLLQEPVQHQYAVVKKSGSKRDIRENLERENSAIIKVRKSLLFILLHLECHSLHQIPPKNVTIRQIARNCRQNPKLKLSHTPCIVYCHCFLYIINVSNY